jgi:hypothetical protein
MRAGMRVALAGALFAIGPATGTAAQPPTVEPASLMTTPVYLLQGNREVSQGTGFFFGVYNANRVIDTVFLVTNYHVVTGHSPRTSAPAKGDRVVFYLHTDQHTPSAVRQISLPLFSVAGAPLWVQSDDHPEADLVLLPIPAESYRDIEMFVFVDDHIEARMTMRPTSPATLLGYPYGFSDTTNRLPVWKTGHVASEPKVDFQGTPSFLVDVSAFPGMSGSPVLAGGNGVYEDAEGVLRTGRVIQLLGVFSAMPVIRSEDPTIADTSLELGIVWKASLIVDLARAWRSR